uniref:Cytochrome P450 71A1-like n=1 Tax=Nicotiana tabacum TaxID=4097 RepID=A0A1S3ZD70_TOBAC|nr:PREDICTED: cytochrome P450 71A1-like [Nicotiana tabacum]
MGLQLQTLLKAPMSFLQQLETNFQLLLFVSIILALALRFLFNKKRDIKLPPSPLKLPIIGNLHQLGNATHKSLHCLAKKLGPIMYLKLGEIPIVVLSSAKIAKEVIRTHDLAIMRKICILELLSTKRVQLFSIVRVEEVARLVHRVAESYPGTTTNLSKMLALYANDVICRVAFGKLFTESIIHRLTGLKSRLEDTSRRFDKLLDEIMEDHIRSGNMKIIRTLLMF